MAIEIDYYITMISQIKSFVNAKGSSSNFSAHGWRGKEKNLSAEKSVRRKVLGAKPKQAGKKEGGWGEGIFARLLPFPFRLRKGKAEGGFGGNSARRAQPVPFAPVVETSFHYGVKIFSNRHRILIIK